MRRRTGAVLGVAVSSDAVRAVLLKDERVVWTHEVPVSSDENVEAPLRSSLAEASRQQRGSLSVAVAVGPAHAQLRHLSNLPAIRDARTLAAVVQQSAGRYFRQNGIPMLTTAVAGREAQTGWAGAIEEPVAHAVVAACLAERYRRPVLLPTAAVLGYAVPNGSFAWRDGDVALELVYEEGELRECRCMPSRLLGTPSHGESELAPALRALGPDAVRFADAVGAARGGLVSQIALGPRRGEHEPPSGRFAIAAAACIVSLAVLLIAPGLQATRQNRAARRRLETLSAAVAPALAMQRQLTDSARILAELARFQRSAPSTILLLASLTRAIEPPTTLVSLRLDGDGGTLTALTPSAASLLTMLEAVPEIGAPAITGSVTPEATAPAAIGGPTGMAPSPASPSPKLERVTIRFHWQGERRVPLAELRAR